jgi:hypothetical protein
MFECWFGKASSKLLDEVRASEKPFCYGHRLASLYCYHDRGDGIFSPEPASGTLFTQETPPCSLIRDIDASDEPIDIDETLDCARLGSSKSADHRILKKRYFCRQQLHRFEDRQVDVRGLFTARTMLWKFRHFETRFGWSISRQAILLQIRSCRLRLLATCGSALMTLVASPVLGHQRLYEGRV